jgi:hypothetical protein
MSRTEDIFKPALTGKQIPVLPLDNKWHRLFTQYNPSPQIKKLEEEINKLLKRQGKLNTESKDIKKLKKKMMDEIVGLADEVEQGDKKAGKKLEENRRLINECNEKIEAYQDELMDLPTRLKEVNYQLMILTMEICYEQIKTNTEEINEIAGWIAYIRKELKKKIIRKQEKEIINNNLYQYMHQVFGVEVIEIFDLKYIPEMKKTTSADAKDEKVEKKENEKQAAKEEQVISET